jgi:hypothetical protein
MLHDPPTPEQVVLAAWDVSGQSALVQHAELLMQLLEVLQTFCPVGHPHRPVVGLHVCPVEPQVTGGYMQVPIEQVAPAAKWQWSGGDVQSVARQQFACGMHCAPQALKPVLHATPHTLLVHAAMPFIGDGQSLATQQPLAGTHFPSHTRSPAAHCEAASSRSPSMRSTGPPPPPPS